MGGIPLERSARTLFSGIDYYKGSDGYYDCTLEGSVDFVARGFATEGTGNRDIGNMGNWNKMKIEWQNYKPTGGLCAENRFFRYDYALWCEKFYHDDYYVTKNIFSKGYDVPEISLYKCKDIAQFTPDGDGVEVWLRHDNNRKECARVDTFGVDEQLKPSPCGWSDPSSADKLIKFMAFPETSGAAFQVVLRPLEAVRYENNGKKGLNVCLNRNGRTKDCGVGNIVPHDVASGASTDSSTVTLDGKTYHLIPKSFKTKEKEDYNTLKAVTLRKGTVGKMLCLETSYDKLLGRFGDPMLLTESSNRDRLQISKFSECDSSSDALNRQTFLLRRIPATDNDRKGGFVLHPKYYTGEQDMCLKAGDIGQLEVGPCSPNYSKDRFKTENGRIVPVGEENNCLFYKSGDAVIRTTCTGDKSFVSVIPIDRSSGDRKKVVPEGLEGIFPESGIHLMTTGDDYEEIEINPNLEVTDETTFTFSFQVLEAATRHELCFTTYASGEYCFKLHSAGASDDAVKAVVGGQAYSSGVQNYSIKPKERIDDGEAAFEGSPWENLKFNEGEKITSVKLVQEGAGLSIFYNLQVYNGVPITVDSRGADFLTFVVDFSGLSTIDTYNNFFYLPSVFEQDKFGDYNQQIKAAEKKKSLEPTTAVDKYGVTVDRLNPGKRYLISLEPVDSLQQSLTDGDNSKAKANVQQYTSCTCANHDKVATDFSGSPGELPNGATQSNGRVKLKFAEGSHCGDGFSFTRRRVASSCNNNSDDIAGDVIAFAPDYFVESSECDQEIDVSLGYQDYVSELDVGAMYCYHIRAFAKEYMVDTDNSDGRSVRRSDPLKLPFRVAWESSAKVVTKMSAQAGGLPIKEMTLEWDLRKGEDEPPLISGTHVSPANGVVTFSLTVRYMSISTMR